MTINTNLQKKDIIKKIIYVISLVFIIFLVLSINKSFAADIKMEVSPKNPKVGDTIEIKVNAVGNDVYSLSFQNLDESSNLTYVDMDSIKKTSNSSPFTGSIKATYKIDKSGETWVKADVKVEYAEVKNKKLDLDNIQFKNIERKLDIDLIPDVEDIEEMEAKFKLTDNEVNIRPHPSTKYSSIGYKSKNDVLDVTGKKGEWYQFKYNDGFGYIHSDFLEEIKEDNEEDNKKSDILETEEEIEEEVRDPKVKDPKDVKDNTNFLIVLSVLLSIGITISIIYLVKESNKEEDSSDNIQRKNKKRKNRSKNEREF